MPVTCTVNWNLLFAISKWTDSSRNECTTQPNEKMYIAYSPRQTCQLANGLVSTWFSIYTLDAIVAAIGACITYASQVGFLQPMSNISNHMWHSGSGHFCGAKKVDHLIWLQNLKCKMKRSTNFLNWPIPAKSCAVQANQLENGRFHPHTFYLHINCHYS